MSSTDPVQAEDAVQSDLVQRQREAIKELSTELVEVAQRSPQALTLLQLDAVTSERDDLAARLAAVEALVDEWERTFERIPSPARSALYAVMIRLRAALATTDQAER